MLSAKRDTRKLTSHLLRSISSMILRPTIVKETAGIIAKLELKRSTDQFDFSSEMVRSCSPLNELHLCNIINKSFEKRTFPHALKIEKLLALFENRY